jgi:hypothetical protein
MKECCCVVRNTINSVTDSASPYCIEGGGKNYVLTYSNKNSHSWKKPLQLEERDSDARDVSGVKTPLFLAIRAKHLPAIRLLIGTHLCISILSKYYALEYFSHILYNQPVYRIRIRIGSGYNLFSGSVFGIQIRFQEVKNAPPQKKNLEISCFKMLDVLF